VDVSNPSAPVQVATAGVGGQPNGIAISGRYAYVANNATASSSISVVDVSNPNAPAQIATTGVGTGPIGITLSGRYAFTANFGTTTMSIVDIGGTETNGLMAHSAELGGLQVLTDARINNQLFVGGGLMVGSNGVYSSGPLAVTATSTTSTFQGGLQVSGLSTFAGQALFGTTTPPSTGYKVYIDSGASTTAGLGVNGYIKASGFITGTTTLDLAEQYPINQNCVNDHSCPEPGDAVCVAPNTSSFVVEKCSLPYSSSIIGVISTDPGFTLGGLSAPATRPVALAGRVPLKVSTINGSIKIGDQLTTSNFPGVAQKATATGTTIATALEDYNGDTIGHITAFVHIGLYLPTPGDLASINNNPNNNPLNSSNQPSSLLGSILDWFKQLGITIEQGIITAKEFIADTITSQTVQTNRLCLNTTCVTETELRSLLNNSHIAPAPNEIVNQPISTPNNNGNVNPSNQPSQINASTSTTTSTPPDNQNNNQSNQSPNQNQPNQIDVATSTPQIINDTPPPIIADSSTPPQL